MTQDAQLILAVGAVLAAGVAAAGVAARLRLPALVLFAGLGMLVGSDGLAWVAFDDYRLVRLVGTIALVLILFEGGLAAGWRQLRPVLAPALLLAVIGTVVTAAIVGLAAAALFDFSLLEGLLLGAILAATDGAAVFALLRGVRLPLRLRRTLEGESGLNDPVAVLLVLVVIDLINKPHHESVLLSRGPAPALVLDGEHEPPRTLELSGPRLEAADPTGSGDSMFAALGVGLATGSGLVNALKIAVAAGALNATR